MSGSLKEFIVRTPADISLARQSAKEIARRLEFGEEAITQLMTVASELAANLLQHAGNGRMIFSRLRGFPGGLKIETIDSGPGITDIDRAMADGFSASNSLGYGLGAINRLMDTLEIQSPVQDQPGTRICCCRYLPDPANHPAACPFEVGVASRPVPGMNVNGDGFITQSFGANLLVGVIDGLGHGEFAHLATEKIRQYVQTHFHLELPEIFHGANRSCQGGRGAVMSLIRLDWSGEDQIRMSYGALGNIEARVHGRHTESLPVRRGILGKSPIHPAFLDRRITRDQVLVMFSDGLRTHWQKQHEEMLWSFSAAEGARRLLPELARNNDDATLVIVKSRPNTSGQ